MADHMSMDPFVNQFPVWTPEFQSTLRGLELALKAQDSVQRDVDYVGLRRVIGGIGQGQGTERSDKPTASQKAPARSANHYSVFCTHEVPYWRPCKKCGRDKAAAAKNVGIVLRSVSGAAFHTK